MSTEPTTKELAKVPQGQDLVKSLTVNKASFEAALGAMVPVDYFIRVATTTIRKNPLLASCTPQSVLGCLMDLAQIRLLPDSVLGEAYLVPFFNSKLGKYEAVLMIGYKGLVKCVRRNRNVKNVTADVVYERDKFVYRKGSNRVCEHTPHIGEDKGAWLGAYAYIQYEDGGEDFEFVQSDYIERVRKSSKNSEKPDSIWNTWPESMWKKTALRQLCKLADISPDVQAALNKDIDTTAAIDVESYVQKPQVEPSKLTAPAKQIEASPAHEPVPQQEAPAKAPAPRGRPPKAQTAPPVTVPPPAPPPEPEPEPEPERQSGEEVPDMPFYQARYDDAPPVEQEPEPEPEPAPPPPPAPKATTPKQQAGKKSASEMAAEYAAKLAAFKQKAVMTQPAVPTDEGSLFPE